jgi:outer membrane murein-binding lipoprotein Lpp
LKSILAAVLLGVMALLSAGCGNLSPKFQPKQDQKIDNQNGQIRDITNEQNGLKAEILSLKQQAEISNSKLDHIQQGLANFQSDHTNNGVQIFSGSGGLFLGFAAILVFGTVWYYRNTALVNHKAATILAEKVAKAGDENLTEEVFKAAMYSDAETKVYHLMKKATQG